MPDIRRTFEKGIMNQDVDERLLPNGYFRSAENIIVNTSEGSDVGAIEKALSNKKLTNLNLGSDAVTLAGYSDETKRKIYWFVWSSRGTYLIEYSLDTKIISFLLEDTRPIRSRVLALNKGSIISGMCKIISEDIKKDMFIWTDNSMEVCCINIERAKRYGPNGFEKEDIYLIKKPPAAAPRTKFSYISGLSNNIEEKFMSFAYRYKYLDGDYSALSSFTSYKFYPSAFKMDYETLDNLSMVNQFSAISIGINTGDKRVTEIQVVAKESNSNTVYIIESFNKKKQGWGIDQEKFVNYSNNKVYIVLPENEFLKQYDNVPRRAKALTTIGNRLVIGNYTEGYDLIDKNNFDRKINIDFEVSLLKKSLDIVNLLDYTLSNNGALYIHGTRGQTLVEGSIISFFLEIKERESGLVAFSDSAEFVINSAVSTSFDLYYQTDFQEFINVINQKIQDNLLFPNHQGWVVVEYPKLYTIMSNAGELICALTWGRIQDPGNSNNILPFNFEFIEPSSVSSRLVNDSNSLKTNRDYEVSIIYQDEFKRSSTALTSLNNTAFVAQSDVDKQSKLMIRVNNKAPSWARYYKFAVKSAPLSYENIFINIFYNEDVYTWCKLEGSNKDKVKDGDIIIIKSIGNRPILNIIKITVLEIKSQPRDFITGNKDNSGTDLIEQEGMYMKIKPNGFTMGSQNYKNYSYQGHASRKGSGNYPYLHIDLNSNYDIPIGSTISLFIDSNWHPDRGWRYNTLEKTFVTQTHYASLKQWVNQHVINQTALWGNVVADNQEHDNYAGRIYWETIDGKEFLTIKGTKSGKSGGSGHVDFKLIIRTATSGLYVFETEPKKMADTAIFYETEETFKITNSLHHGNISNQSNNTPAEVLLDSFYNCFNFGNGIESYKIKDRFNKNFLGIDLRPTTTSIDEYGEVTRYSDVTYSDPYVESAGMNGLNSFNLAKLNWKELDKNNGSISHLLGREGNLLVCQLDKIGQVLFGKDAMYNADGTANVAKVPYVLGEYIPYAGEYGLSHPESFATHGNRVYGVDTKRGLVWRLSNNGISPITYGMEGFFREELTKNSNAKIIGGYDPYNQLYQLTIGDNERETPILECSSIVNIFRNTQPFTADFHLNQISGTTGINYDISEGIATIEANYQGKNFTHQNVSGPGRISIDVNAAEQVINAAVIPVSEFISFQIGNECPIGREMKIVNIVLTDISDQGKVMTNRIKWDNSPFYANNYLVDSFPVSHFEVETGIEGIGKFPERNSIVRMEVLESQSSFANFSRTCNRLGYLVSDILYNQDDFEALMSNATLLIATTNPSDGFNIIHHASFNFTRTNNSQILYLIWDYRDKYGTVSPPQHATALWDEETENTVRVSWAGSSSQCNIKGHEISFKKRSDNQWSVPVFRDVINENQVGYIHYFNELDPQVFYDFRIRTVTYGAFSDYIHTQTT
ncbi:fibronectin type III domain-containing protein [Flavobacterium sp. JP2137]|uniref:fibronectin type III domain-containing protein n=1 Tax=Flavobacterium sp. JP2137 TaxID=3414510 RepID=UPI003D3005CC